MNESGGNLNVLVEAKKEYMEQLCMFVCPLMIDTFSTMYQEAVKLAKNKKNLNSFQVLLKEVPNWNNHMIKQHTIKLCNACAWFSDLLAAVFVSCVKILSAVRLNSENKKISLKLPSNEVFIHGCYEAVARELYKDPHIFQRECSEYERDANLTGRFRVCVEDTIKRMIPIQQILHTYISQGEKMEEKNIDFNSSEGKEDAEGEEDDPELSDHEEEAPAAAPAPASAEVPAAPVTPDKEEIKEINLGGGGENSPAHEDEDEDEDDEGELFPDAPSSANPPSKKSV
jgi:hypothetical protein